MAPSGGARPWPHGPPPDLPNLSALSLAPPAADLPDAMRETVTGTFHTKQDVRNASKTFKDTGKPMHKSMQDWEEDFFERIIKHGILGVQFDLPNPKSVRLKFRYVPWKQTTTSADPVFIAFPKSYMHMDPGLFVPEDPYTMGVQKSILTLEANEYARNLIMVRMGGDFEKSSESWVATPYDKITAMLRKHAQWYDEHKDAISAAIDKERADAAAELQQKKDEEAAKAKAAAAKAQAEWEAAWKEKAAAAAAAKKAQQEQMKKAWEEQKAKEAEEAQKKAALDAKKTANRAKGKALLAKLLADSTAVLSDEDKAWFQSEYAASEEEGGVAPNITLEAALTEFATKYYEDEFNYKLIRPPQHSDAKHVELASIRLIKLQLYLLKIANDCVDCVAGLFEADGKQAHTHCHVKTGTCKTVVTLPGGVPLVIRATTQPSAIKANPQTPDAAIRYGMLIPVKLEGYQSEFLNALREAAQTGLVDEAKYKAVGSNESSWVQVTSLNTITAMLNGLWRAYWIPTLGSPAAAQQTLAEWAPATLAPPKVTYKSEPAKPGPCAVTIGQEDGEENE